MEILRIVVGVILPYVALVGFVGGMAYRLHTWRKLPAPSMTLFPAPLDGAANTWNTIREVALFRSLLKGDGALWCLAWGFHAVLLLIFIGHFRVFADADAILRFLGMSEDGITAMSSWAGGVAGVLILCATLLLLGRRVKLTRVREVTGAADYLALLLIAAVIITGDVMRFGSVHFDLTLTREYFARLVSFGDVLGSSALQHNVFLIHLCLALVLLLCIPFSKLLHFGGIFFTHQLIRKQ